MFSTASDSLSGVAQWLYLSNRWAKKSSKLVLLEKFEFKKEVGILLC